MTRRPRLWRAAAAIFTLINLAGAGFAVVRGEPIHAGVHAALLLVGAYLTWRLAPRAGQPDVAGLQEAEERLARLQQSVDAIALEVERIGEAQRFSAKLQQERGEPR